jgi:superfamily II DNA or RNA helicase
VRLPYVIDNQNHRMADVLGSLLMDHQGRSLDIATAYFTVGGFGLLREGLDKLGSLRLLLGAEPESPEQLGLRPGETAVPGLIRRDLEDLPYDEVTLRLIEDFTAYLHRDGIHVRLHQKGFLHAKAWLFYSDRPGQQMFFDRFKPILAIVGSSNFTAPGLTSNRELNLTHRVLLDPTEAEDPEAAQAVAWLSDAKANSGILPADRQLIKSEVGARAIMELEKWYESQWDDAGDFKQNLLDLLEASKFGRKEYTPFEVYLKALYEYYKDDLDDIPSSVTRSAVELSEFQEDAVKKARKVLARYDGVIIADSVGLGKTWIGKKLLEDYAYHLRQKALVVCPAALRPIWERALQEATIQAKVISQEELGREGFDLEAWSDADVVLVDESHNFRSKDARRYQALDSLLDGNGGRGKEGRRKKIILMTATPINNDLFDLYNQLNLITRGDRGYFASCGIGDLYKYFLNVRRDMRGALQAQGLFNLLEEIVIRRTRSHIRKAYPEATIQGKKVNFPRRRLRTVRYNLESSYSGVYDDVVADIEQLTLVPYQLEKYKKAGVEKDIFEEGREAALAGIFKTRYLKRFESSLEAFRISVARALQFHRTFSDFLDRGTLIKVRDYHKMAQITRREEEDDLSGPESLADAFENSEEVKGFMAALEKEDPALFDLDAIKADVKQDIERLSALWGRLETMTPANDAKLNRLKELLATELNGKKVIIFTQYKDTARYLYQQLGHPERESAVHFKKTIGNPIVRRLDSGADADERARIIAGFSPKSNHQEEWVGSDKEIQVLISTDVLAEGQNLQDCGQLLNYDLHWNPTRMVQRAGRIDRIGSDFKSLWIYNMFPEEGLERLLGLVQSLTAKIETINKPGFLDSSILGEEVHPHNFNALRKIREEDEAVLEEEEAFSELASGEFMLQQLKAFLAGGGQELLSTLPDGIHSGHAKKNHKGVFFYFQGKPGPTSKFHFWKYVDLKEDRILDNRFLISNLIACQRDTPRQVDTELETKIFGLQERVISEILEGQAHKAALKEAPQTLDPVQQALITVLQAHIHHPACDRNVLLGLLGKLAAPLSSVKIKRCKEIHAEYRKQGLIKPCIEAVSRLFENADAILKVVDSDRIELQRDDMRLICYEWIDG